jgi:hypothetical protein
MIYSTALIGIGTESIIRDTKFHSMLPGLFAAVDVTDFQITEDIVNLDCIQVKYDID